QSDFSQVFTQEYFAASNRHWLDDYHVDGFSYDEVTDLYVSPTDTGYAKLAYETYRGCVANFAQEVAKGQLPLSVEGLRGQGVEQFGRSEALVSLLDYQLPFLDHVHELNPHQGVLGCLERFEPQHRPCHPLDTSMILLHNVVEILNLADGDRGAVLGIVALDSGFIGRTPVDGDLLRHAMAADRFLEKAERGLLVPLLGEQKVNGLTGLIHRAIEIVPLTFDLDIGLVHPPTHPHRALPAMKRLF